MVVASATIEQRADPFNRRDATGIVFPTDRGLSPTATINRRPATKQASQKNGTAKRHEKARKKIRSVRFVWCIFVLFSGYAPQLEAEIISIPGEPASRTMIDTPDLYCSYGSVSWKRLKPGDDYCGSTALQMSRDGHVVELPR